MTKSSRTTAFQVPVLSLGLLLAITPTRSEGYTGLITRTVCGYAGKWKSAGLSAYECPLNADNAVYAFVEFAQPIERAQTDHTIASKLSAKGVADNGRGRVCVQAFVDDTALSITTTASSTICTTGTSFVSQNLNVPSMTLPVDGFAYARATIRKDNANLAELPSINLLSWTFEAKSQ